MGTTAKINDPCHKFIVEQRVPKQLKNNLILICFPKSFKFWNNENFIFRLPVNMNIQRRQCRVEYKNESRIVLLEYRLRIKTNKVRFLYPVLASSLLVAPYGEKSSSSDETLLKRLLNLLYADTLPWKMRRINYSYCNILLLFLLAANLPL